MATTRRGTGKSTEEITAGVYEDRKVRMRKLIDLAHDGSLTGLLRHSGSDISRSRSSYLQQLLGGHRPITERAARGIEVDFGKPYGWLDKPEDAALQALAAASSLRVSRLLKYINAEFGGEAASFLADRNPGARREKLIEGLLDGSRFLSEKQARVLEVECGLPVGLLDQE